MHKNDNNRDTVLMLYYGADLRKLDAFLYEFPVFLSK